MSDSTQRVVITGGSGLIGRALTDRLAAAGREVIVLSRSPQKVQGLPAGARAEGWDGETVGDWARWVEGAAIIHLAGAGIADQRWSESRKKVLRESRLSSSRAVTAAAQAATQPPSVLLHGSAVGYYGFRGDETLDESSAPGEGFLPDLCVEWEAATETVEDLGVRRVLLRTGIVLATEGGALAKMLPPFRLGLGGPLGSGDQWMPWIHLDDQVEAMVHLLQDEEARGPFNLSAPNPATNKEFSKALGRALHRPAILPAPGFAIRLAFGEMAQIVLRGQRAIPARLGEQGYAFRFPELAGALADLVG